MLKQSPGACSTRGTLHRGQHSPCFGKGAKLDVHRAKNVASCFIRHSAGSSDESRVAWSQNQHLSRSTSGWRNAVRHPVSSGSEIACLSAALTHFTLFRTHPARPQGLRKPVDKQDIVAWMLLNPSRHSVRRPCHSADIRWKVCIPLLRGLVVALATCTQASGAMAGSPDPHTHFADFERVSTIPAPKSNPITPEKAALGQLLFFDPRLSGSGALSCATCHNPALGWSDALPTGLGHMGGRLGRHHTNHHRRRLR